MNAKLTLSLSGSLVRKGKLAAQVRDTLIGMVDFAEPTILVTLVNT